MPPDHYSAAERWPVVKALRQFGSFSGVRPGVQSCKPNSIVQQTVCSIATFDWSKAKYASPYVSFVHRDLMDWHGRPLQKLNATELKLYNKYVRISGPSKKGDIYGVYRTLILGHMGNRHFPLLVIGRYVQTASQIVTYGEFQRTISAPGTPSTDDNNYMFSGYSFAEVQQALMSEKSPAMSKELVPEINAEANVITALICHQDGNRPIHVCERGVIQSISRYIK